MPRDAKNRQYISKWIGHPLRDWHPISSAPHDRDLELSVIDGGEAYALVFPCRRKGQQWVHAATGRLVLVEPTHWREWQEQ
jgi:hypothetical protein